MQLEAKEKRKPGRPNSLKHLVFSLEDYYPDWSDPLTDKRLFKLRKRLDSLEVWERNLLFLYAREQSYRKVGKILKISYGSIFYFVNIIRNKLLNGFNNN